MVGIKMQDIKTRRGQKASSQINSGGQVSMKMSIGQSKTADIVNSMERGKKKLLWFQLWLPPAGPSQLYFI